MPLLNRITSLVRNLLRRERVEDELEDELRATYELLVEEKLRAGMDVAGARRVARLELDGIESVKEEVRRARTGAHVEAVLRDVRYAARLLVRSPRFAAVVIVTLALGIGINSAVFSLVNALLLRPLPYPEADRMVWIATPLATSENLEEWRAGMRSLERMGAFSLHSSVLTGRGPAERVEGMDVTRELLPLLGGVAVRGRLWTAEEQRPGGPATVVVSHAFWERLGRPDVGMSVLRLDGVAYTIIGVLGPGFRDLHYDSGVFFPAEGRRELRFNLIGLRRPDLSVAQVRAEATALASRIEAPGVPERMRFANVQTPGTIYKDEIRAPLLVLFAAAAFVLLIACANVANLLLSRAAARSRELAVRSALGAGRATLLRQLLTESAVLALAGAALGWIVAVGGLRAVLAIVPEFYGYGRINTVRMDRAVLAFTFVVALVTTILAGTSPAMHAAKLASRTAAGWTRATASRGARRFREALMTAEIALALVLLIGTVLMVRTFLVLRPASPGFEVADRMIVSLRLPSVPPRSDAEIDAFARRLLGEVSASAPGARVAIATDVPLSGSIMNFDVAAVDGTPPTEAQPNGIDLVAATPNYFDVMGMRVLRGRGLSAADVPGSMPVAIVNETMAARFWPDTDPMGRRIAIRLRDRVVELAVVGVAANARSSGNNTSTRATAFVSFWQLPFSGFELVLHQPRAATLNAEEIRRMVAAIDAGLPVGSITMLDRIAGRAVATPRYHMLLMMSFGALAVVLALVGCYGVLSFSVAQRTREIGVRIALGASHSDIVRSVVLRAALLVTVGLVAGATLALATTRVLESSLYGVEPTDPATFALAAAGLALVALIAAYLPARRAAAVQPTEALRFD
jgi:putative ABC transport system permease protein